MTDAPKRSQRVCRAVRYPHRACLDEPALVSVAGPEPAPEPAPGGLTRSCTGCSSMGAGCGRLPATWAVARTPSSAERVPRPGRNWPKAPGRGPRPGLGRARLARKCRYHGPSVAVREIADGAHRPSDAPHAVRHASVDTATPRATALHGDTTRDREKTARTAEKSQLAGRLRRWWQVLGSNQRRLSRRFYRPIPPPESHATDQAHTPSEAASWAAAVRYMSVRWKPRAAEPADGYGRRPQSLVGAVSLGQEARDFP